MLDRNGYQDYLDQGYNRIPLHRSLLVDLDTPLAVYRKLADRPFSFLFESVRGDEQSGRHSIIGLPAATLLKVWGEKLVIERRGKVIKTIRSVDPLQEIERFSKTFRVPDIAGLPRFSGGLVGYFGYETICCIETKIKINDRKPSLGCPDILLMVTDRLLVFDNRSGILHLIVHTDPEQADPYQHALLELNTVEQHLRDVRLCPKRRTNAAPKDAKFTSSVSEEAFTRGVGTIKDYILAGDVMQTVLSQRLSIPFHAAPLSFYRALRHLNPSPYLFYLNLQEFHVAGSSPEILVRLEDNLITVRPIAGTRPRGRDDCEDHQLAKELLADPKERAEHIMLIDLGRNDVGRVAKIGSVELTDRMTIERYSHVMHIVSNVSGRLLPDKTPIDLLRAVFPAGTLSGAPKIRAMEIIEELEPTKRGIYGGAIGYLSWQGDMDTAIAIRTGIIKNNTLYVQAGAGIVADSDPKREWEETMNKANALLHAAEMTTRGDLLAVE